MLRVLIISSNPLFSRGIETLLGAEAGLEIVGQESHPARAAERVDELALDVVILDSTDPEWNNSDMVLRILNARGGIRVVALNLIDNRIDIYREEHRVATGVSDLVGAVRASLVTPTL